MVLGRNTSGAAAAVPFALGRARTVVVSVVAAAVAALAFSVAPAQATTGHAFRRQLRPAGSNDPGGFACGSPSGVAVDQSTGDVFATDPGHTDSDGRLRRASSSSTPPAPSRPSSRSTRALQLAGGHRDRPQRQRRVYVGATDNSTFTGTVLKYSLTGTPQGVLTPDPGTIAQLRGRRGRPVQRRRLRRRATDSDGAPLVAVFDDAGAFQPSFDGSVNNDAALRQAIDSIAVDGSGSVYVTDPGKNRLDRFERRRRVPDDGHRRQRRRGVPPRRAVTADPATDEIYARRERQPVEYFTAGGAAHQDHVQRRSPASWHRRQLRHRHALRSPTSASRSARSSRRSPARPSRPTGSSPVDATTQTLEGTVNPEGIDTGLPLRVRPGPRLRGLHGRRLGG